MKNVIKILFFFKLYWILDLVISPKITYCSSADTLYSLRQFEGLDVNIVQLFVLLVFIRVSYKLF